MRKKVTNTLSHGETSTVRLIQWVLLYPNVGIINASFWISLGYLFRSNEIINFCLLIVKSALVLAVCRGKNHKSSVTVCTDTVLDTGTNAITFVIGNTLSKLFMWSIHIDCEIICEFDAFCQQLGLSEQSDNTALIASLSLGSFKSLHGWHNWFTCNLMKRCLGTHWTTS